MEQELIERIYNMLINDLDLTEENLLKTGLTKEEITLLLERKIIKPREDNQFELYRTEKFHQYGIRLLKKGQAKEANICFKKCFQMSPNGRKINMQLMLSKIKWGYFEEAFEYYKNLEDNDNGKHRLDNNLYLYLLNLLMELPEEYQEKIKGFTKYDLIYPPNVINKDENMVRIAVCNEKFSYACNLLNDLINKKQKEYSIKFEVIKALLSKVIDKEKEFKSKLLYLAETEQYFNIINLLKERSNKKKLNKLENYVLIITDAIIKIINTKQIPEKTEEITHNMYRALMGNNFELAIEINDTHHLLVGTNKDSDVIHVLLLKIIELIKQVENKNRKEQLTNPNISLLPQENELTPLEKEIKITEDIAYYIESQNLSLEEATKKLGIKKDLITMIKLVYIRDYYIEGKIDLADAKLEEIEKNEKLTPLIIEFIDYIKKNKENNLDERIAYFVRKRIKESE